MIVLDTDVFSLLELPDSLEYLRLRARIAQIDPLESVATTVVTYEEQTRGRLAVVSRARTTQQLTCAYGQLRQHIHNYSKIPILDFDGRAVGIAVTLRKSLSPLGTMDIRIAAIVLSRNGLLLSRNLRDFRKVPELRVEDWSQV